MSQFQNNMVILEKEKSGNLIGNFEVFLRYGLSQSIAVCVNCLKHERKLIAL
jgi:hypothetical protein